MLYEIESEIKHAQSIGLRIEYITVSRDALSDLMDTLNVLGRSSPDGNPYIKNLPPRAVGKLFGCFVYVDESQDGDFFVHTSVNVTMGT